MRRLSAGANRCDSRCLKGAVDADQLGVVGAASAAASAVSAAGRWRASAIGGPAIPRFAARFGRKFFNAYALVLGLLPGTPVVYYGDEIGMSAPPANVSATPMQWTSDSATAGFTTSRTGPSVPLASEHETFNVEVQRALGADHNNLEVFEAAMKLRKEPAFAWGRISESSVDSQIYSYLRHAEGFPAYIVAVNVGDSPSLVDFVKPSLRIPAVGVVVATTGNIRHAEFSAGSRLQLNKVYLRPAEGLVLRLDEEVVRDDVVVNGH